jgi:hypothetical protein
VSARSFTFVSLGALLGPFVEVEIVVHGFVARRALDTANERIGGIVSVGGSAIVLGAAEVTIDRFPDDGCQRNAPPTRLITELAVRRLVKP